MRQRTPALKNQLFTWLALVTATTTWLSCASSGKRIEIKTNPEGAEIQTLDGETLGRTPFVMEEAALIKASKEGRLAVRVLHPNYLSREFIADIHSIQTHELTLTEKESKDFRRDVLTVYSNEVNQMQRELLRIQGLILVRRYDEAETSLQKFQASFPNVASSYVMRANIARLKGKTQEAYQYLLRAQSIDPEDPVVMRMLGSNRTPAGGQTR